MHNPKNRYKAIILDKVRKRKLSLKEAARLLDLSYRQTSRIYKRFLEKGEGGLIHGLSGKPSNRKINEKIRREILEYYQTCFSGLAPTLAAKGLECLGYSVSRETLKRWLRKEKISTHSKKRLRNIKLKKEKIRFGQKVHLASCHFGSFNGHSRSLPLIKVVDEATGITLCLIAEDGEQGLMQAIYLWIKKYGVPDNVYCDFNYIYKNAGQCIQSEQFEINTEKTAFGIACEKLYITANLIELGAQRKQVQWCYKLYKDLLEVELKSGAAYSLRKINNLVQEYLRKTQDVKKQGNGHRRRNGKTQLRIHNLNKIFSFEYKKLVSDNLRVNHDNRSFQILAANLERPAPGSQVILREWLDGSIHIYLNKNELYIKEVKK